MAVLMRSAVVFVASWFFFAALTTLKRQDFSSSHSSLRGDNAFALVGSRRSTPGQTMAVLKQTESAKRSMSSRQAYHTEVETFTPSWISALDVEDTAKPAEGVKLMPVFPLGKIAWPGETVQLEVEEPGRVRMYEDIMLSGKRHVVATLTSLPVDGDDKDEYEHRIWNVGTVLELDSFTPVGVTDEGHQKFIAKHSVVGRIRLHRVHSPADIWENEAAYVQAEVGQLIPVPQEALSWNDLAGKKLTEAFDGMRTLAEEMGEPALTDKLDMSERVLHSSSWHLAGLWQEWRIATYAHREQKQATNELGAWMEARADEGLGLEEMRKMMPPNIIKAFQTMRRPRDMMELRTDFWEPLLSFLAIDDVEDRRELLLGLIQDEVRMTNARKSLKALFS